MTDHGEWIKENEPGTIHYFVHKLRKKSTLVVYERYEDKAAFAIHGKNLAERGKEFMKYLAGNIDIMKLEDP